MLCCLLLTIAVLIPGIRTETVTTLVGRAGIMDSCRFNKGTQIRPNVEAESHMYMTTLKCGKGEYLSSVWFNKVFNDIVLTETTCISEKCCMGQLGAIGKQVTFTPSLNNNIGIQVGTELEDTSVNCSETGNKIRSRRVVCERVTESGTGWNLLADTDNLCTPCSAGTHYNAEGNTCQDCPKGTYSGTPGAKECTACPRGTHTASEGATLCHCDRGLVRSARDPSVCEYCPAGHTTYLYAPDTCIGPQLHGMDAHRKHLLTVGVGYDTLGNLNRAVRRWESTGNWNLKNKTGRKVGYIYQKYTSSYSTGPRSIRRARTITAVEPIINNVYCYDGADRGVQYKGYANKTRSGKDCTGPYCTIANKKRVCYCRNKNSDMYNSPYCTTDSGVEYCDIPKCKSAGGEVADCEYEEERAVSVSELAQETGPITTVQFGELKSAQITCNKLGGECVGVWLSGGTVRLTRLSPAAPVTDTDDASFFAKSSDCGNPYYEQYFTQSYE